MLRFLKRAGFDFAFVISLEASKFQPSFLPASHFQPLTYSFSYSCALRTRPRRRILPASFWSASESGAADESMEHSDLASLAARISNLHICGRAGVRMSRRSFFSESGLVFG